MDRLRDEQLFHNLQARARAGTFAQHPEALCFGDDDYLEHETWIRPAIRELGTLRAQTILDYGCGHGMASVVLARGGAHVTAFDLSLGYLDEARTRARANGVSVKFVSADGERLPFADNSFDRLWGNAILHHVDLDLAARELWRVLRPGGWGVFCEPWGENAFLNWARNRLPYPRKQHTAGERPFRRSHLLSLRAVFASVQVKGFQFLSMARRILPHGRLLTGLERCDALLLKRLPSLARYCRYVVLTLRK
jgi:SAM-dependent methyltransferase